MRLNETSIYTEPLKFSPDSFPTNPPLESEPIPDVIPGGTKDESEGQGEGDEDGQGETEEQEKEEEGMLEDEESPPWITDDRRLGKRQWDLIDSITEGVKGASTSEPDDGSTGTDSTDSPERQDEGGGGEGNTVYEVPTYNGAIHYKVPKTGYYCVGTSFPCSLYSSFLSSGRHMAESYHNSTAHDYNDVRKLKCRHRTSNTPKPTFPPSPLLRLLARPRKETSKPRRIFRLRPV